MSRKVYVSLGSNKGGEFLTLQKSKIYSEDFVIYAFEPEERCFKHIEKVQEQVPNITHIKACAGTYDGIVSFNVGKNTLSGSVRKDKKRGLTNDTIDMESIDICEWLNNNINEDDYVILTMDIEGSEYDILPIMLENKCSDLINKIYIEFHGEKMKEDVSKLEKSLKENLHEKWGTNFFDRYVEGNMELFGKTYKNLDSNMFNNIGDLN